MTIVKNAVTKILHFPFDNVLTHQQIPLKNPPQRRIARWDGGVAQW